MSESMIQMQRKLADVTSKLENADGGLAEAQATLVQLRGQEPATCNDSLQVELLEMLQWLIGQRGKSGHNHKRPCVWDDDNGAKAGTPCETCAMYDHARALLQSSQAEIAVPDCRTCANRGRVNGISEESYCESCVYQGSDWRQNHFVDASTKG